MSNKLADSASPYLLQHAENPVDWLPWSQEALAKAQAQDKPIFLSIGYAACHWCHVMAHESFEDPETAALMNEHFISIKVDREERPDVDSIYMDAVVAMTGSGGWPLSVFLTPEGEPFFGGTYFPPERRHGMPSFQEVLTGIAQSWDKDREDIQQTGNQLASHLAKSSVLPSESQPLDPSILQQAAEQLHRTYDWRNGGWGSAPKFPQASTIEYLLYRYARKMDRNARDVALHSLKAMAHGGIYDHLGGGFARYSVDAQWRVPHFEKMLYDNALLLNNYLQAWQLTSEDEYLEVAKETFEFLHRELRLPAGGYASSLDADSEGEEGKFYAWEEVEVRHLLEPVGLADLFIDAFGVSSTGNFEGKNVLYRARDLGTLAEGHSMGTAEVETNLAQAKEILFEARKERVRPGLDDKVLTSWNGLLLTAFARGAQATGEAAWLEAAQALASFLTNSSFVEGQLMRSWHNGRARFKAYLEDHAALGIGLLELYATDFNPDWYAVAEQMADKILDQFSDPEGGFFDTAEDHEPLLTRPKSLQDSPIPSGNSLAVRLLQRMAALTGDDRYRKPAEKAIGSMGSVMAKHPTAFATWLSELAFALGPQIQLAIIGNLDSDIFAELSSVAMRKLVPDLVVAGGEPDGSRQPRLLEGREDVDGEATAYLCQSFACQLPTDDPQVLAQQLEQAIESSRG